MPERDEYLIDLDAFAPAPGKRLKFRGQTYALWDFQDLPLDDALVVLRIQRDLQGKSETEQIELMLRRMAILAPEMDRATLGSLSLKQVFHFFQEVMGAAEVPPMGGDGPSGSATSSPSSPGSTAGPGARSAA